MIEIKIIRKIIFFHGGKNRQHSVNCLYTESGLWKILPQKLRASFSSSMTGGMNGSKMSNAEAAATF
jgi:fructose-bisphosphate aldolase class 1